MAPRISMDPSDMTLRSIVQPLSLEVVDMRPDPPNALTFASDATGDTWTHDVSLLLFRAWAHARIAELTPRVWVRWRVVVDESKTTRGGR